MEITCPACAAVYAVEAGAIPDQGRMVRCGACRAEWRARPQGATQTAAQSARARPEPPPQPRPAAPSPAAGPTPPPAATPRYGAAAPAAARVAPPLGASREAPPAAAPISAGPSAGASAARAAPSSQSAAKSEAQPVSLPASAPGAGATPADDAPPAPMLASLEEPDAPAARGGFLVGFALTAALCLGAVALYARHEAVAAAAPQLAGPIERYVEIVDEGRRALAALVERARGLAGSL